MFLYDYEDEAHYEVVFGYSHGNPNEETKYYTADEFSIEKVKEDAKFYDIVTIEKVVSTRMSLNLCRFED